MRITAFQYKLAEAGLWVLASIASYIVAQYAVTLLVWLLFALGIQWEVNGTVSMLLLRIAIYIATAALLAGYWRLYTRKKASLADFGLARLLQWKDIGTSVAGAIVYLVGTVAVLYIATTFFSLDTGQAQDLGISSRLYGSDLLLAFVVLVICTPILEEMLFRGFLYGKLRSITSRLPWWLPAFVVSVLFGVAHGQWNVGLDVFVLSMVACGLREVTGSIWAGIVLHMLKNMVAFIATFVFITGIGG